MFLIKNLVFSELSIAKFGNSIDTMLFIFYNFIQTIKWRHETIIQKIYCIGGMHIEESICEAL